MLWPLLLTSLLFVGKCVELKRVWRWSAQSPVPIAEVDRPAIHRLHFRWLADMRGNVLSYLAGRCSICDFGAAIVAPRRGDNLWISDAGECLTYRTNDTAAAVRLPGCQYACFECLVAFVDDL